MDLHEENRENYFRKLVEFETSILDTSMQKLANAVDSTNWNMIK